MKDKLSKKLCCEILTALKEWKNVKLRSTKKKSDKIVTTNSLQSPTYHSIPDYPIYQVEESSNGDDTKYSFPTDSLNRRNCEGIYDQLTNDNLIESTSSGNLYSLEDANRKKYILKVQWHKTKWTESEQIKIWEEEYEIHKEAAKNGFAPKIYDAWLCESKDYPLKFMTSMEDTSDKEEKHNTELNEEKNYPLIVYEQPLEEMIPFPSEQPIIEEPNDGILQDLSEGKIDSLNSLSLQQQEDLTKVSENNPESSAYQKTVQELEDFDKRFEQLCKNGKELEVKNFIMHQNSDWFVAGLYAIADNTKSSYKNMFIQLVKAFLDLRIGQEIKQYVAMMTIVKLATNNHEEILESLTSNMQLEEKHLLEKSTLDNQALFHFGNLANKARIDELSKKVNFSRFSYDETLFSKSSFFVDAYIKMGQVINEKCYRYYDKLLSPGKIEIFYALLGAKISGNTFLTRRYSPFEKDYGNADDKKYNENYLDNKTILLNKLFNNEKNYHLISYMLSLGDEELTKSLIEIVGVPKSSREIIFYISKCTNPDQIHLIVTLYFNTFPDLFSKLDILYYYIIHSNINPKILSIDVLRYILYQLSIKDKDQIQKAFVANSPPLTNMVKFLGRDIYALPKNMVQRLTFIIDNFGLGYIYYYKNPGQLECRNEYYRRFEKNK